MNTHAEYAIAMYLCKGRPCKHHLDQAKYIMEIIKEAEKRDRDEEAKKALERLAASVAAEIR